MIQIVKKFYKNNNYTIRDISLIFDISKSTIHRWLNSNIINTIKKININYKIIMNTIEKYLLDNPFIIIKDIQHKLYTELNIKISISGIYIYLKKINFSYK